MTTAAGQELLPNASSFRDAQWKTKWLLIGASFFLLWRCLGIIGQEWWSSFSPWLLLIVTGLIPHIFMLVFPFATRRPKRRGLFKIPSLKRCLIEFGIATLVVIATTLLLATANYLISRFLPGTSLGSEFPIKMARSSKQSMVYLIVLFSFTFAPFSEEVFFRGFLFNAFRARMPWIIAVFLQCLFFAFGHLFPYGVLSAVTTFFLGLILTLLYEWRKTLVTPVFVHAGINMIAAIGIVALISAHNDSAALGIGGDSNNTECVILEVVPNSPADKADLRIGDVIKSFNGETIHDFPHLLETIRLYKPGDPVAIIIERKAESLEVYVVLCRHGDL